MGHLSVFLLSVQINSELLTLDNSSYTEPFPFLWSFAHGSNLYICSVSELFQNNCMVVLIEVIPVSVALWKSRSQWWPEASRTLHPAYLVLPWVLVLEPAEAQQCAWEAWQCFFGAPDCTFQCPMQPCCRVRGELALERYCLAWWYRRI